MRIHHLNCGSMCPFGRRFFHGTGGVFEMGDVVCHCLLIESEAGLVLVDAGLSTSDLDPKRSRVPLIIRAALRPVMRPAQSALAQVRELGFSAKDVRHIVLTHLDFDHAGGISDFPEASVHVFADEHRAAMSPPTFAERRRYLQHCWSHAPRWQIHELAGDAFYGFESVRALTAKETDILLVPVQGHSRGHVAVAVRQGSGYLVHCGDAYFHHDEMNEPASCPVGFRAFQTMMAQDDSLRLKNQDRLRALKHAHPANLTLFSAHDALELERLRNAPAQPQRTAQSVSA
ncbi:MAG: MBL fold metallo-hydrolase [Myxococcales bacterium]